MSEQGRGKVEFGEPTDSAGFEDTYSVRKFHTRPDPTSPSGRIVDDTPFEVEENKK